MPTPTESSVPLSGTDYIDGLLFTSSWQFDGISELTYSFHDSDLETWTAERKAEVVVALQTITNVANVTFREVEASSSYTDATSDLALRFGTLESDDPDSEALGEANPPDPTAVDLVFQESGLSRETYPNPEGDVTLNDTSGIVLSSFSSGGEGIATLIHEVGHAIGLKHPHDDGTNGFVNSATGSTREITPTYAELGIGEQDSQVFTFMSYVEYDPGNVMAGRPATPMMNDIEALQYIYGVNTAYNAGDTVITLADDGALRAIWDAGGNDTLDAAGIFSGIELRLEAGSVSVLGEYSVQSIARSVTIENAHAGAGADLVVGNDVANGILGGGGADSLIGLAGNDRLVGDAGGDLIYGNVGTDTILGGDDGDAVFAGQGDDLVYGNGGADTIAGNLGDDTLYGGQGDDMLTADDGNDVIVGGVGDDTIDGGLGNDTLDGGDGADIFRFAEATTGGIDRIVGFADGDLLSIDANLVGSAGNRTVDALLADAFEADGSTTLALDGGAAIILIGTAKGTLDGSDFTLI